MLDTSLIMNSPYDVIPRTAHSTSPGSKNQVISFTNNPKPPETKKSFMNTFRMKMAGVLNIFSPSNKKSVTIRDQRRIRVRNTKEEVSGYRQGTNTHDNSYEEALNNSSALNNSNVQALTKSLMPRANRREKVD
eukprot:TRINITY_DN20263_c0_g1_i2.p1 TRINITY_DN20263_c0_g1~~TRINITY_DN20263_c0_g1_i2.p1  ORF type:complete len:134 (+),score=22.58 TRINITY_DN20263_c0_g1_i2:89-490(+)